VAVELAYETVAWTPAESGRITEALYEEYELQSIRVPGSQSHPTKLVQVRRHGVSGAADPSYRRTFRLMSSPSGLLSTAA